MEICGKNIEVGDYVKVEYTTREFPQPEDRIIFGKVIEIKKFGDVKQAKVESGWCFHEGDKILEHEPMNLQIRADGEVIIHSKGPNIETTLCGLYVDGDKGIDLCPAKPVAGKIDCHYCLELIEYVLKWYGKP